MNKYVLTLPAFNDLDEIYRFIAKDHPRTAVRFINKLEHKCSMLAGMQDLGTERNEIRKDLRMFLVDDYNIFYEKITEGIRIVRILNCKRKIKKSSFSLP